MIEHMQPDPSMIGGVQEPPFARLPDPVRLFQARARRFAFLAESNELASYLKLLADLSRLQARLAATLPVLAPIPAHAIAQAIAAGMPPVNRLALVDDPALAATLAAVCEGAAKLVMPAPARLALEAVQAAGDEDRQWLLGNILSDMVPQDSIAPHLFASVAVQVHAARLSATLDVEALRPLETGICPSCGGRPVTSSVMGAQGVENVRYATCATCATQWNEVRVKCLCCGSTAGMSYRSAETHDATVKAECCSECDSWVKIFYLALNPTLEPVADDVGSLGLDMLMKTTRYRRRGFNPYLVGY